jgi:hypothetical protein
LIRAQPQLNRDPLGSVMETWIPLVAFALQTIVLGVLLFAWLSARRQGLRAASLPDVDPAQCYRQTGGARLDGFNVTIPFATIVVTPSRITLSCFGKSHIFEKAHVRSLSRSRGLFSTGLQIEHSKTAGPSSVIFWTTSFPKLASALERLGWVVAR